MTEENTNPETEEVETGAEEVSDEATTAEAPEGEEGTASEEKTESEEAPASAVSGGIKISDGDSPDFKWYVVHALSGFEHRVSKTLKENILNHNLTEYFSDILVPEETVVTSVKGKKRNIKKKFFPGYVLIKMILNDNTWHVVKNTDKITGFVGGNKNKPSPISDEEANFMINQNEGNAKVTRSVSSYSAGDSVKVIEGPFASFVGTVESVSEKGKLKVNVSIFGRPTPVELEDTQVEKV
jgi:transcriptional antiterminator NusG